MPNQSLTQELSTSCRARHAADRPAAGHQHGSGQLGRQPGPAAADGRTGQPGAERPGRFGRRCPARRPRRVGRNTGPCTGRSGGGLGDILGGLAGNLLGGAASSSGASGGGLGGMLGGLVGSVLGGTGTQTQAQNTQASASQDAGGPGVQQPATPETCSRPSSAARPPPAPPKDWASPPAWAARVPASWSPCYCPSSCRSWPGATWAATAAARNR